MNVHVTREQNTLWQGDSKTLTLYLRDEAGNGVWNIPVGSTFSAKIQGSNGPVEIPSSAITLINSGYGSISFVISSANSALLRLGQPRVTLVVTSGSTQQTFEFITPFVVKSRTTP